MADSLQCNMTALDKVLGRAGVRPLVVAQFISLTGTQITALALPVLAVLYLGAGPMAAALLFAIEYGVRGISSPALGVLVDAVRSPRRLLITTDLVHAVLVASVPAAYHLDALSMTHLVVVAGLSGMLSGITDVSINSVLPRFVAPDDLVPANSSLSAARAGGQIVGPAAGGVVVQILGAATAVVGDAASYLFSAAVLSRLPRTRQVPATPSDIVGRSLHRSMNSFGGALGEGLATFRATPPLPRVALASAALNLGGAGLGALYMINAYRALGLTPVQVGITMAVYSAAALLAVLSASRVTDRLGLSRTVATFAPVAASALLLIPAAKLIAPFVTLIVYETIFGYCATVWTIAAITLKQRLVPADRLGRVVALHRTLSVLAIPVGGVGAGIAAEIWGLQTALVAFAMVAIAGTVTVATRIPTTRGNATRPAVVAETLGDSEY